MKFCQVACGLLFLSATQVHADRRVAFERGNEAVYVANLDGTGLKKVADGIFPAISPDGTRVAFNTVEKTGSTYVRHIAVVDIATGNTTTFTVVPSDNSYYPTWSPDGKWIAFTLRKDEVWHLGMIKEDGTGFNFIKKGAQNQATLYSPCWGRDQKSIFCQDMTNIYQLGLDGSVLAQWKLEKIVPNGNMSGDGRIDVSPDGKRLLLSIDMGEEHNRKDWDGPPPALWSFDLTTQISVRLTPKKLFAWDGCWLDHENILFLDQPVGEKEASIYRMSTDGKNLKRLIKNARLPSVSAP
jgi:TolB protein